MSEGRDQRVLRAIESLRGFAEETLAFSKVEAEAKLIDAHLWNPPFEPAHLHNATQHLIEFGELERSVDMTRGGGRPPLIVTTAREGRTRRVADASARKRLLMSRYYSFVQGGDDARMSLAGPAGEAAFRDALSRASIGATIAETFRGLPSVSRVFGEPVPVGPLDNAFILQPLDSETMRARPPWGVHALVEVKNIREWVYPRTQELYQVLVKSALIQRAHPGELIMPILVCRRAHPMTKFMAKDLGFYVIEARRQFLPESSLIDPAALLEITSELGISDLVQGSSAAHTSRIEKGLLTLQPTFDVATSVDRWRLFATDDTIVESLQQLFDDDLTNRDRDQELANLRDRARDLGAVNGW